MISPDVVIITKEELKVIEDNAFRRGVAIGKFEHLGTPPDWYQEVVKGRAAVVTLVTGTNGVRFLLETVSGGYTSSHVYIGIPTERLDKPVEG